MSPGKTLLLNPIVPHTTLGYETVHISGGWLLYCAVICSIKLPDAFLYSGGTNYINDIRNRAFLARSGYGDLIWDTMD